MSELNISVRCELPKMDCLSSFKCAHLPVPVKEIFGRKDKNGNMELVVDGKLYPHGTFEITKEKKGGATIRFFH